MKPVSVARVVLVLLVALLALAPRTARPAAADGIPQANVADGSRYVLVNLPKGPGVCTPGPKSLCPPGAPGVHLAASRVHVGPARLPATATAAVVPAPCPDQGAVCGTV